MATIRSYTTVEQSRKLAEILPPESVDMKWYFWKDEIDAPKVPTFGYSKTTAESYKDTEAVYLPCWSLASLLSVLPKKYYPIKDHETDLILGKPKDKWCVLYWDTTGMQDGEQTLDDNPVDACVEMIIKLHEMNLL